MQDRLRALVKPFALLLQLTQDFQSRLDAGGFFSGNRQNRLGVLARLLRGVM